jgi:hypothetical protein
LHLVIILCVLLPHPSRGEVMESVLTEEVIDLYRGKELLGRTMVTREGERFRFKDVSAALALVEDAVHIDGPVRALFSGDSVAIRRMEGVGEVHFFPDTFRAVVTFDQSVMKLKKARKVADRSA